MSLSESAEAATPLNGVEALFLDLDGVVYRGKDAVPNAVEALNNSQLQIPVGYITNNASRTPDEVAEQLQGFGLKVQSSQVVTSAQAAAALAAQTLKPGDKVFVVGGTAIEKELSAVGLDSTRDIDDSPVAVVQGFHPTVNWSNLADAAYLVQEGAVWIATNSDWTIPRERGIAPGNGTLVSAVHTAAGPLATVAGKPEKAIFDTALTRFGVQQALMIGDRLDTDVQGAKTAGLKSALVLTGIDQPKQIIAAPASQQPDYVIETLADLYKPYPVPVFGLLNDWPAVNFGEATVALRDQNYLEIIEAGNQLDLFRAACHLIWASGRAIYGFYVPEEIYQF